MSTWLPIETAPRDGTDFLAFEPGRDDKKIWPDMIGVGFFNSLGYFRISWIGGYDIDYEMERPTHWMPLPEPPEASGLTIR